MTQLNSDFEFDGYQVSSFLKEGLYNDTYRVHDVDGHSYFMKIYDDDKAPKIKVGEELLISEIQYCKRIHHQNIISFKEEGKIVINGKVYPYMITDYFSGELLADKLNRTTSLPFTESMTYIDGVIDGPEYLHGIGLIHNDITPRNIMFDILSEDDGAKIS